MAHILTDSWYLGIAFLSAASASGENEKKSKKETTAKKKPTKAKRRAGTSSDESSSSDSSSSSSSEDEDEADASKAAGDANPGAADAGNETSLLTEKRKKFLLTRISPFPEVAAGTRTQVLTTPLDGESAELITRFLASKRPFSKSFDSFLKHILKVAPLTEFPPYRTSVNDSNNPPVNGGGWKWSSLWPLVTTNRTPAT